MRLHVLETVEPVPPGTVIVLPLEEDPAELVWQTQQPLITSRVAELTRWPRLLERVQPYGVQSYCWLPLTTARRRLGTLAFTCKQPSAYDTWDVDFLQQVANQVAVTVENALAFQEIEALNDRLHRENVYLEEEARAENNFGEIVGESVVLRRVLTEVETVAPTDSTVLIRGDTGTGKELIMRALHELSPRQGRTFVKLNCAAIPTGHLESELFGHEKGAFTGAICQKVGRFELAHQGTLFLDEVGDIPHELQNVIERAVILSPGASLQVPPGDLQPAAKQAAAPAPPAVSLADAEREHILGALRETGWVLGGPEGAAARLGMKTNDFFRHSTASRSARSMWLLVGSTPSTRTNVHNASSTANNSRQIVGAALRRKSVV
jgi:transcriptional regulator with GAF, ATPase, and Fis domain